MTFIGSNSLSTAHDAASFYRTIAGKSSFLNVSYSQDIKEPSDLSVCYSVFDSLC